MSNSEWPPPEQVKEWKAARTPLKKTLGILAEKIMTGEILTHEALPHSGLFALEIGCNVRTVERAKRMLGDMGMAVKPGGVYLAARPPEGRSDV